LGRVLDTRNEAVPGVSIMLTGGSALLKRKRESREEAEPASFPACEGTSANDGSYEIPAVPPGRFKFFVIERKPKEDRDFFDDLYGGQAVRALNAPFLVGAMNDVQVDVIVPSDEEGVIAGHVRDEQGEGVSGVKVLTVRRGGIMRRADTDRDGHYRISRIEGAGAELRFKHPDYAIPPLLAVPVGTTNADSIATRPACMRGRAVDGETGKPLSSFSVQLAGLKQERDHHHIPSLDVKIGTDRKTGGFEISGLPAGATTIEVSSDGRGTIAVRGIVVRAGETSDVGDIALHAGGVLEGCVRLNGAPTGAAIDVWVLEGTGVDSSAFFGRRDGIYKKADLSPGTYRFAATIRVPGTKQRLRRSRQAVIEAGKTTELNFEINATGTIRGVLRVPTGYALARVVVRDAAHSDPVPLHNPMEYSEQVLAEIDVTSEDGSFELRNLAPGDYSVSGGCANLVNGRPLEARQTSTTISLGDGEEAEVDLVVQ
jgi:carboxypeptidase family protein